MIPIRLFCRRLERSEILSMISPDMLAEIKASDPNPVIAAYVVAGDGEWHPVGMYDDHGPDIGEMHLDASGVAQVIEAIHAKIKHPFRDSLRMWPGHTNAGSDMEHMSQPNRPATAYVVGVAGQMVDGHSSAIVAAYFPPETAQHAKAYGAVSLEMMTLGRQAVDWVRKVVALTVEKVTEVTGIALLDRQAPAYSGAKRMGIIYAQRAESEERHRMDLTSIPFQELMAEFKRRNVFPTQAYEPGAIVGERHVLPDGKVKWVGGDREIAATVDRMIAEEAERVRAEWSAKLAAAEEQIGKLKPLEAEVVRARAVPELLKKAKATNDPVFAAYVERRSARFQPGENMEQSITDFLASEKAEYDEDRKLMVGAGATTAPALGGTDNDPARDKAEAWLGVDDVPSEFLTKRT